MSSESSAPDPRQEAPACGDRRDAPPSGRGPGASDRGGVMRRVVVTGLGVVAPNGVGKDAFWKACVDGHSGIGPIRSFDASNHPIRVAGEIMDFDPEPFIPDRFRKSVKLMGRAAKFGVGAAGLAVADSGLDMEALNPERFGVVMGTGLVPMDLGELAPLLARACQ